jgi:L-asparaginase
MTRAGALAAALLILFAAWMPAAQGERPHVRLIATGGTIANHPDGRLQAADLLARTPELDRYVVAEAEQLANVASTRLTLAQWLQLARRLNELFRSDPRLAGAVVAAGTDTLEEIAYFLHLTVKTAKPVVLVGSMRSPAEAGYDGPANLLAAFRVAADAGSGGRGVLVVLNDEINSARDVTKADALRLDAFRSSEYGALGVVDPDRVVYLRNVVRQHTTKSEFDVSGIRELPRVDVLMTYQGASGDLIAAAVESGARGVVIASAGAGSMTRGQADAVAQAAARGVVVVVSTRTGAGRVTPATVDNDIFAPDSSPRLRQYLVVAEDLAPIKSRVLLMLALAKTSDPDEIQRMFREY